jgi:hypothetical protein
MAASPVPIAAEVEIEHQHATSFEVNPSDVPRIAQRAESPMYSDAWGKDRNPANRSQERPRPGRPPAGDRATLRLPPVPQPGPSAGGPARVRAHRRPGRPPAQRKHRHHLAQAAWSGISRYGRRPRPDLDASVSAVVAVARRAPAPVHCCWLFQWSRASIMDAHFLRVFTPGDLVGRDGQKHQDILRKDLGFLSLTCRF